MRIGPALLMALIITATPHAQMSNATPSGVISGRVVDIDSGEPLPDTRVTVTDSTGTLTRIAGLSSNTVTTDSEGRFAFSSLPPGLYAVATLTTEANVTNRQSPATHVRLDSAQSVRDVIVRSVRSAWIRGRVTDEAGDPMVGTTVVAFTRAKGGAPSAFFPLRSSVTDDRGDYTIDPLLPGDYIVCACQWMAPILDPGMTSTRMSLGPTPRSADVPVEVDAAWRPPIRTFHPSATQPGLAGILSLRSNEGRTGVDIGVSSARLATVSGRIAGLMDVMPASAIRLQPVAPTGAPVITGLEPDRVEADGTFRFQDVPPGDYRLLVRYRGPDSSSRSTRGLAQRLGAVPNYMRVASATQNDISQWSDTPLVVDGRDVTGLQITVAAAMRLSGVVRVFDQGRTEPLRANGGKLERLEEPIEGQPVSSAVRANDEGGFELEGVIPGRYTLDWTILPPGLSLKSVTLGGREVTDLPFVIDEGQTGSFEVTLTSNEMGRVSGRIVSGEAPTPRAVVVFPSDRRFWDAPSLASRRFVQAIADQDGRFDVEKLPPGQYVFAPAPSEGYDGTWRSRLTLETLVATGQLVTIGSGNNPPVEIRR